MRWIIKYAKERVEEVIAENFNEASDKAKQGKKEDEIIVSVRTR